jgi:hypothetical protein
MSEPHQKLRLEDSKVPLQAYPLVSRFLELRLSSLSDYVHRWQDLQSQPYETRFNALNGTYPTALLRLSVSGIPYESHLDVTLNDVPVGYTISTHSRGQYDRAWIQVPLESGLMTFGNRSHEFELAVRLTELGRSAPVTQGGKMLSSVELIEYGPASR